MLKDASFIAQDSRSNFKQIIAKRSDLTKFASGRMVPAGSGATLTYEAGLVIGLVTASGKFAAYNNSASDGTEVARGVLLEKVVTDEFGNDSEMQYVQVGELFTDLLIGLDSAAKTDMAAKESVEHGTNLIRINA